MSTILEKPDEVTPSKTGYTTVSTVSSLFEGLNSENVTSTNDFYGYFASRTRDNTTYMTNNSGSYSWGHTSYPQVQNTSLEIYDPVDIYGNWTSENNGWPAYLTDIRIPFYIVILILAVVGNTLVIVTLAQNKRMRTVTNVFLLNLSISDLLLAIFCMPFTLIPSVMRNFVFGKTVCILIRYLQGK